MGSSSMGGTQLALGILASIAVLSCDAFNLRVSSPLLWMGKSHCLLPISAESVDVGAGVVRTITTTYETTLESEPGDEQQTKSSRLARLFKRNNAKTQRDKACRFAYEFDEMVIGNATKSSTTAVMLIHPIGVGIGKWYYDRLLASLQNHDDDVDHRLVFLSPDLLGSATASGPMDQSGHPIIDIPLLNITDWNDQVTQLMAEYEIESEKEGHAISSWSVVANGGCSPIALKVASSSAQGVAPFKAALTNVIISSPPRLPFFLECTDPEKVRKSYRTLSGITGKLFWWYSLRKEGKFIQKFSEKNLVGDADCLGEKWTPNCLKAARCHDGLSRYSTFAFLAGTLQDGCVESLNALKRSPVMINIIRGSDKRRNRAKSWFWTRKKKKELGKSDRGSNIKEDTNDTCSVISTEDTIAQYVNRNGNGGKELFIGGRISLAWEDSRGYAKSLMDLLCD